MILSEVIVGRRVRYVYPYTGKDDEYGHVTRVNNIVAFVKFDGEGETSQAVDAADIHYFEEE